MMVIYGIEPFSKRAGASMKKNTTIIITYQKFIHSMDFLDTDAFNSP